MSCLIEPVVAAKEMAIKMSKMEKVCAQGHGKIE
jgi:hypothetical protein